MWGLDKCDCVLSDIEPNWKRLRRFVAAMVYIVLVLSVLCIS